MTQRSANVSRDTLETQIKVALNLDEWRMFWERHGQRNDRHSVTRAGMAVTYHPDRREPAVEAEVVHVPLVEGRAQLAIERAAASRSRPWPKPTSPSSGVPEE